MAVSKFVPLEAMLRILAFLSCLVAIAYTLWSTQTIHTSGGTGSKNGLWIYPAFQAVNTLALVTGAEPQVAFVMPKSGAAAARTATPIQRQ